MSEATLEQILANREERVIRQREIIKKYSCPAISFTMNIAGPKKNSPSIERAFLKGVEYIKELLPEEKVKGTYTNIAITGCESLVSVDMDARKIKKICLEIEDSTPLGRLFDMDVIDTDGKKIERSAPRKCIICGRDVWECSRKRIHSVAELQAATEKIINEYFAEYDSEYIANTATESLIKEVCTTPKPGLVDLRNNGSHTDMNSDTFIKSAYALKPYFKKCVRIGQKYRDGIFPLLKQEGVTAENSMYTATGGVNTHKGIIYSMGILCGCIGSLWSAEKPIAELDKVISKCIEIVHNYIKQDFASVNPSTAGGRLYLEKGLTGIRGEVMSGFKSVTEVSLPVYKKLINEGTEDTYAGVIALVHLIAQVQDTNLYHRGGAKGADFARKYAQNLIECNNTSKDHIEKMDDEFIAKNLSPGGCADLLAITYFLYDLYK